MKKKHGNVESTAQDISGKVKAQTQMGFQMNNDTKLTDKLVTKRLKENKINVLEWPPQSPDLITTEYLWAEQTWSV